MNDGIMLWLCLIGAMVGVLLALMTADMIGQIGFGRIAKYLYMLIISILTVYFLATHTELFPSFSK